MNGKVFAAFIITWQILLTLFGEPTPTVAVVMRLVGSIRTSAGITEHLFLSLPLQSSQAEKVIFIGSFLIEKF